MALESSEKHGSSVWRIIKQHRKKHGGSIIAYQRQAAGRGIMKWQRSENENQRKRNISERRSVAKTTPVLSWRRMLRRENGGIISVNGNACISAYGEIETGMAYRHQQQRESVSAA